MRKKILSILVLVFSLLVSCEKNEIPKLNSISKKDIIQCRGCGGGWDLNDTIP